MFGVILGTLISSRLTDLIEKAMLTREDKFSSKKYLKMNVLPEFKELFKILQGFQVGRGDFSHHWIRREIS